MNNSPDESNIAVQRKLVAPRTYVDQFGRFWSRPTINRRRTWRLIVDAKGQPVRRKASAVAQSLNTDWRPNKPLETDSALIGHFPKKSAKSGSTVDSREGAQWTL